MIIEMRTYNIAARLDRRGREAVRRGAAGAGEALQGWPRSGQ